MQAPMQALLESLPAGHPDETLARALNPERLPAHIAIIMDGNGRWARRRGQLRVAGHKAGMRPGRRRKSNRRYASCGTTNEAR